MFIKSLRVFLTAAMMLNLCGCWGAFLLGAAGGAGAAVWASGKLSQNFNAPYQKTIDAVHTALHQLNLPVTKESTNARNTEIKGTYSDGRDMWVDIERLTDHTTKVVVRIGGVTPDKNADNLVLNKIQSNL